MGEGIAEKNHIKVDANLLSLYTNYQEDHTKPYDTILGCKVNSLDEVPRGMVGQSFDGGIYGKFVSKGDLTKGAVFGTWSEINQQKLNRVFTADFELYGEKAQNPTDAQVEVYVGI